MSLIPVDAEYHYVQDTPPASANSGDVWLDTSVNPPVAKIYADVGSGLEWLVDQSSDRIAANLDAPVSEAGQGVDWSTKTVEFFGDSGLGGDIVSVSGSGYILNIVATNVFVDTGPAIRVEVDGSAILDRDVAVQIDAAMRLDADHTYQDGGVFDLSGPIRFDSGFTVSETRGFRDIATSGVFVLD